MSATLLSVLLAGSVLMFLAWSALYLMNLRYYADRPASRGPVEGVTLIRPLRGLDAHLEANLQSAVDFRPEGPYQILLAMESESDPAFACAARFRSANPGTDIEIVITGPSGERMGKIHNMIEAVKKAKHPLIAFSDSDHRFEEGTFPGAFEAFSGNDGIYFLPYSVEPQGLCSLFIAVLRNYVYAYFYVPLEAAGALDELSGPFMAVRKSALEEVGGLEQLSRHINDDVALGHLLGRHGKKKRLAPRLALVPGEPMTLRATAAQLKRRLVTTRAALGLGYYVFPFLFAMPLGCAVLGLVLLRPASGWLARACLVFAALALATRWAAALSQDLLWRKKAAPLGCYLALPALDLILFPLWCLVGIFAGDRIEWRGKHYRVKPGGLIEVL